MLVDQRFGGEPDMIFLVHARNGTVDDAAVAASGQAFASRLGADTPVARRHVVLEYARERPAVARWCPMR